MNRTKSWIVVVVTVAANFLISGTTQGQGTPLSRLRERFPGIHTREGGGERIRQIFGVPMTSGQTPRAAAEGWIAEYAPIFGGTGIDLRETWVRDAGRGKTTFAYQQFIDDLPVYGSIARVTVLNGDPALVAAAAAKVAPHPEEPLPQATLSAAQAMAAAIADPRAEGLDRWGEPSQAVWCGAEYGLNEVVGIVWLCSAWDVERSLLFVVNARTGQVHAAIDQILRARAGSGVAADTEMIGAMPRHTVAATPLAGSVNRERPTGDSVDVEITGTVSGTIISQSGGSKWKPFWGDGNHNSCEPSLVEVLMPDILVEAFDSSTADLYDSMFTDENGEYSLMVPPSTEVNVRASLIGPLWKVKHCQSYGDPGCPNGQPLTTQENEVVGPTEVELEYDSPGSEPARQHSLAQTNSHFLVSQLFEHYQATGALPASPFDLEVNANVPSSIMTCNGRYGAYGSPPGQLFIETSAAFVTSGCPNNAYSTILGHEFGHYIHVNLGFGSAEMIAEGFADAVIVLFFDTTSIGENWLGCSTVVREFESHSLTYPRCNNDPYDHGIVLAATWRDIRENTSLGTAQALFGEWAAATVGEDAPHYTCNTYPQGIGPGTMIEVLVADDDDANFANGTPNGPAICSAFCENTIPIPDAAVEACEMETCPDSGGGGTACRADCDSSTGVRVLDVWDFLCFMDRLGKGDPEACRWDESTGSDVCDIFDLLAFQTEFALGCD